MAKKKKRRKQQTQKPRTFKTSALHKSLYHAALRYYDEKPWNWIEGEDFFAVRVPGESDPLAVSVLGAAGQEYGLSIMRGPSAVSSMTTINLGGMPDRSTLDVMSLSMEPYKTIPAELRMFYKRAGIKPRAESRVPLFFVKTPYQIVREPRVEEVETWLTVINGVLQAIKDGILRADGTFTAKGVLTLRLSGDPESPHIETEGKPTAPSLEAPPPTPTLLIDRQSLIETPTLDEWWIVACRVMPIRIHGMPDEMRALFVMDERSGFLLKAEIVQGVEAFIRSAQKLVDLMIGKAEGVAPEVQNRKGRPQGVVFTDPGLYDLLEDHFEHVGIEKNLAIEMPPLMQEAIDSFKDHLQRG